MIKLKWKVASEPTGRYRSFEHRGWPGAEFETGRPAVALYCDDAYYPRNVKTGNHAPIKVCIADYTGEGRYFKWRTLVSKPATLDAAKDLAQRFWNAHPEMLPSKND